MNVFGIVTERIIKELEMGVVPWQRPWTTLNGGAYNFISGRSYSLLNRMLLKHAGGYATWKQIVKLGGRVKPGEQPEIVTFWKIPEETSADETPQEEDLKKKEKPVLRYYHVYHISQCEGLMIPDGYDSGVTIDTDCEAEELIRRYVDAEGINLIQGISEEAYYSPGEDLIQLSDKMQFRDATEYYGVAFHEMAHSTGTKERLDRLELQNGFFGSACYSREELTAEIASACLLHTLDLSTESSIKNSAAYCYSWIQALKGDNRMVVLAASQAEKAARFVLERAQFDHATSFGPEITITA